MTNYEIEILKLLGFKPCKLIIDSYSLNGYIVTKHSYYWIINGNFPYTLCKTYENDKNIRFSGYSNLCYNVATSEEYKLLIKKNCNPDNDSFHKTLKKVKLYKIQNIKNGDFYIEDLHIDNLESFKRVVNDIKTLNLQMIR